MTTQPLNYVLIEKELVLLNDIRIWSLVESKVHKQKSWINWINTGDRNTKFFHAQMNIRSSKNTIKYVYTSNGIRLQDSKLVEEEFISSFTKLMWIVVVDLPCPNGCYKEWSCLSYQQRCLLIILITDQDIVTKMKGMALDKTPDIDEFPVEFFTKNCNTMKDDVLCVSIELFYYGGVVERV